MFDPLRFENDNLTPFWPAEIVGYAVNKKIISANHLEFDHVLARGENLRDGSSVVPDQTGAPEDVVRRKPDCVECAPDLEALPHIEKQKPQRLFIDNS